MTDHGYHQLDAKGFDISDRNTDKVFSTCFIFHHISISHNTLRPGPFAALAGGHLSQKPIPSHSSVNHTHTASILIARLLMNAVTRQHRKTHLSNLKLHAVQVSFQSATLPSSNEASSGCIACARGILLATQARRKMYATCRCRSRTSKA